MDSIICVKAQNYDSLTPTPVQQDENKDGDGETAQVNQLLLVSAKGDIQRTP